MARRHGAELFGFGAHPEATTALEAGDGTQRAILLPHRICESDDTGSCNDDPMIAFKTLSHVRAMFESCPRPNHLSEVPTPRQRL
jgi:hypothetical protein